MACQALIKAVTSARITQTQLLLQLGVDVNSQDSRGRTVLMHALSVPGPRVRTAFLLLLLKAGATVSLADAEKRNALMLACHVTHHHDVSLLLRQADLDLDLNARDRAGRTALWLAVDSGQVGVVKVILQALARHELNTEVADRCGVTPAMRAAMLGHLDCLQALLGHVDTMAKSNNTLLNVARINAILKDSSLTGERPKRTGSGHYEIQQKDDLGHRRQPSPQTLWAMRPPAKNVAAHRHACLTAKYNAEEVNQQESGKEVRPALPVIQILDTATGEKTVPTSTHTGSSIPTHRQQQPYHFSLEFLQEPTRCSTPAMSRRLSAPHRRASHTHSSGRISPIVHDPHDPPAGDKPQMGWSGHSHGGDGDRTSSLDPRRRSCYTEILDERNDLSLGAMAKMKTVCGSIRDSLPALFELSAQQASHSFRQTAMRPSTVLLKKTSPSDSGLTWSKVRGLAQLTSGLAKTVTTLSSRTRKTSHGHGHADRTGQGHADRTGQGHANRTPAPRRKMAAAVRALALTNG